jgi:hypothetical protein
MTMAVANAATQDNGTVSSNMGDHLCPPLRSGTPLANANSELGLWFRLLPGCAVKEKSPAEMTGLEGTGTARVQKVSLNDGPGLVTASCEKRCGRRAL